MNENLANFDILRSVAVTMVFCDHLLDAIRSPHSDFAHWLGKMGVSLFFIHTSFVLLQSLARLDCTFPSIFRVFYIRRIFRIYPLSFFGIFSAMLFHIPAYLEKDSPVMTPARLIENLLLIQNVTSSESVLAPMWSLPYEIQMYAFLPFIFLAVKRWEFCRSPLLLVLTSLGAVAVDARLSRLFHYPPLLVYAPWFFMGVLAHTKTPTLTKNRPYLFIALLLAMIGTCYVGHLRLTDYQGGWIAWAVGFVFAFIIPTIGDTRLGPIYSICQYVARYSYAIYLSHLPILWLVFRKISFSSLAVQMTVLVLLLVTVPTALYHLIEEPFIRLGRRVTATSGLAPVPPLALEATSGSPV